MPTKRVFAGSTPAGHSRGRARGGIGRRARPLSCARDGRLPDKGTWMRGEDCSSSLRPSVVLSGGAGRHPRKVGRESHQQARRGRKQHGVLPLLAHAYMVRLFEWQPLVPSSPPFPMPRPRHRCHREKVQFSLRTRPSRRPSRRPADWTARPSPEPFRLTVQVSERQEKQRMARSYRTGRGAGGAASDVTGRFRLPTQERHGRGEMTCRLTLKAGNLPSPSPRPTGPSGHMGSVPLASFVSAAIGHGPAQLMGRGMPPPDWRRRGATTTQGAVASCLPPGTSRVTTGKPVASPARWPVARSRHKQHATNNII